MMHNENPGPPVLTPSKNILAEAFMNAVFFLLCIACTGVFLIYSPEMIQRYAFSFLLLLPAVFLFIIRRLRLPLGVTVLLHGLSAVSPLFLLGVTQSEVVIVMTLAAVALTLYSMIHSFADNRSVLSLPLVAVSVLVHLFFLAACSARGVESLNPFILSSALLILCLFFAARQLLQFQSSFEHFLLSPSQPAKQIYANNVRVILFLCLAAVIIIPVSVMFPYGFILQFLKNISKWIITGILFILSLEKAASGYAEEKPIAPSQGNSDPGRTPPPEAGLLAQILDVVVYCAATIAILFAIYKSIRFLVAFMQKNYGKHNGSLLRFKNTNVTDEVISIRKTKHSGSRRMNAFGSGQERKIRKLYYSTVRSAIKGGAAVKKSSTAGEIKTSIMKDTGKDISGLTETYENIRYGKRSNPSE